MSAPAEWSAFGREEVAGEEETLFNLARLPQDEAIAAELDATGPAWRAELLRDHIFLTVRRAGDLGLQVDPHFVELARQIKAGIRVEPPVTEQAPRPTLRLLSPEAEVVR